MSDSSPPRRADHAILPPPTIYDPADDQGTPAGTDPTGTVVLLLVGEADRRWAASSAIELSAAWASVGRRVVLADLHLENPVLHEVTGDENLEGVVDVFLYGASISRSAHPVRGRGFYLIPAGTYTDDPGEVHRHPRWAKIVAGFRDAGATLVLFAPAEGADLQALAPWIGEVLVLGRLRDRSALAAAGLVVRTHIVEPEEPSRSAPEESRVPAPPVTPPPLREAEPELHLPPPPVRTRAGSRPIGFALWLLLGVVVLAAAGYVVGRVRPDLIPWPTGLGARASADSTLSMMEPIGAAPAAPQRAGEPLPYSVQVIAFQSLPAALQRLTADREKASSELFISPETIDGMVYYKILAGALPDTAAARRLKESLVSDGLVDEEDAAGSFALIQSTPLAFELSEYDSETGARAAADSLLQRNIPAYPIAVPYSDSTRRWQLYAGAYRDSTSAAPMRALLTSAGLDPRLVPRSGLPPRPVE